MTETESLASEIRRSASGETWFGPSLAAVLDGVDAGAAAYCPDGASHPIWAIVAHITVWARYAVYRFNGGVPRELDEDDWPSIGVPSDEAWALVCADAFASCETAAQAVAGLTTQALDEVDDSTPRDELGDPVTLRRIASGLAEHVAYHCGQIAVLKRLSDSGFRVVKATSADLSQLAGVELAAATRFVGWDVPASAFTEASPLESMRVARSEGLLWVASDDARVIGFAAASVVGEQMVLEEIDVLPECSGRGVGSSLVEAVVREARERGCPYVYLSTYRDVPWNGPWYLRLGFELVDEGDSLGQALLALDAERGFSTMPRVALRRAAGG